MSEARLVTGTELVGESLPRIAGLDLVLDWFRCLTSLRPSRFKALHRKRREEFAKFAKKGLFEASDEAIVRRFLG
jgi:hypothetical protein